MVSLSPRALEAASRLFNPELVVDLFRRVIVAELREQEFTWHATLSQPFCQVHSST